MGGEYFVADVVENMIEIPIKVLIFFLLISSNTENIYAE